MCQPVLTGVVAKCTSRGVAKNQPVDPSCIQKAEGKFAKAFARAARRPDCLATPDGDAIMYDDEGHFDDVATLLFPDAPTQASRCTARKLVAAGRKAADMGKCQAEAVGKNVAVDPDCLSRAQTRFAAAFAKAQAAGDCVSSADDAGDVAAALDSLIGDAVCQVDPSRCS